MYEYGRIHEKFKARSFQAQFLILFKIIYLGLVISFACYAFGVVVPSIGSKQYYTLGTRVSAEKKQEHQPGDASEVAQHILELLFGQLAELWELWEEDDGMATDPAGPLRHRGQERVSKKGLTYSL